LPFVAAFRRTVKVEQKFPNSLNVQVSGLEQG
jgi:hypothetical protein